MWRHKIIYYFIIVVSAVLTGCSADDAIGEGAPVARIPLAFDCQVMPSNPDDPLTRSGHTGPIERGNKELYRTGFGVFASHDGTKPDLMYNQHISYTYLGDEITDPTEGYWSYSPRKYWPADMSKVYLCAYAPFVDPPSGSTGIIDMSGNDEASPFILYARATRFEDTVDLLWSYVEPDKPETVTLQMRHALARLLVNVKMVGTIDLTAKKVLLTRITLRSKKLASQGKLKLKSAGTTPTWTDLVTKDVTVYSSSDKTDEASYGNLYEPLCYVEDLPYRWQPAGLQKDGEFECAVRQGDYPLYVYLIPQEELTLNCTVAYKIMNSDGTMADGSNSLDNISIPAADAALAGNTTYALNLTLTIDDDE